MTVTPLLLIAFSAPLAAFASSNFTCSYNNFTGPSSLYSPIYPDLTSCANQPPFYSCENTTAIANMCCSPYPGGLVLQTQFWDTRTGLEDQDQLYPLNRWSIHGLWPDNCDGTYSQYCDLTRQYDPYPDDKTVPAYSPDAPNIIQFLEGLGRCDLLDLMNTYWINQKYPNWQLWAHEVSKHATCFSTFDPSCYTDYVQYEEIADFIATLFSFYFSVNTYDMLAASGIVPNNQTTYTLSQLEQAMMAARGVVPYFGCEGGTVLDEVWHFFHVMGPPQTGSRKSVNSTTPSTCNAEGIYYYERAPGSERNLSPYYFGM